MMALTHFAVGATGGTLLNEKLERDRLLVPVVSGIFAMLPDLNQIVNTRAARVLNDGVVGSVFWFHGTLDSLETGNPEIEGVVALLLLLCATVFTRYSESAS